MKLIILILTAFIFSSCSDGSQTKNAAPDNAKIERNKQVALKNEITSIATAAQKMEIAGRNLDLLAKVQNPNSQRECAAQEADLQQQFKDLETRINNLPDDRKVEIAPLLTDLGECARCARTAMPHCVKSRATINDVIKKLF